MRISRWQPPWPPVQISDVEWVIVRDDRRRPRAIVRRFEFGDHGETWFRVVTWAPASADRRLLGWVRTLELADMLVKFQVPDASHLSQSSSARSAADWDRVTAAERGRTANASAGEIERHRLHTPPPNGRGSRSSEPVPNVEPDGAHHRARDRRLEHEH